jgi:uncharacterized protein
MELARILELDRLAKAAGRRLSARRGLYQVLRVDAGRHFKGIAGPRGAGKTILLQQLAAGSEDGCYVSLDTVARDTDLFALVKDLKERYGFRRFYLDEVHFLPEALGALKNIYDFLDVGVVFTSSVALRIKESAHDLARRVRVHRLDYFTFREYLQFVHGTELPPLTIGHLLEGRIDPAYLRTMDRWQGYITGGLMPFSLEEPEPLPLLKATVETIIARDIPGTVRLHVDELDTLRRLLAFVGRSEVDGINYSTLAKNLGITKYKAEQYVQAFEDAFLLLPLFPQGTNLLREPKVLMMPPLRLLYRSLEEARGGLREDYVALAMRQAGIPLHYLKTTRGAKTPDFQIQYQETSVVLEVGGKGKGRTQFKGFTADRKIVLGEGATADRDRLPLHLLGFVET